MVKNWSTLEKALAGLAAVIVLVVVVLGVVAWRSGEDEVSWPEGCEGGVLDSDLEADASPVDALRVFVQGRDDFPLDANWVLESDTGGVYRFVNDTGGHFEIDIQDGLVRRFMKCPTVDVTPNSD